MRCRQRAFERFRCPAACCSRRARPAPSLRRQSARPKASSTSSPGRATSSAANLRSPCDRRHGCPRSHGPAKGRVDGATVGNRLTARRPAAASKVRLTFRQPFRPYLFLTAWSMRSWKSARRAGDGRHGCPRSHGTGKRRVDGAAVDIRLMARRPAAAAEGRLTIGQPFGPYLFLAAWSMRAWEAVPRPSEWRHGAHDRMEQAKEELTAQRLTLG